MKILIYQPRVSYFTGGGEIYPLQTAKFFSKLGHKVSILTTRASFINPSKYFIDFMKMNPNVKIEYLDLDDNYKDIYEEYPGVNWERWDKESLWVSRLAFQFLSSHKYDIVSTHCVIDTLAIPFEQKHVLHLHGTPNELNYLCKLILPKEKNLIAVSINVAEKWKKLGVYGEIKISTNAIDTETFYLNKDVERNIDLLFVGRLIPIKGVQYIIKALKLLKEKYLLTPKLVIIGDGPYRKELEKLVEKLNLSNQVEFKGLVSQQVLIHSYQTAKIAILPSYDKEGIMSTLLEAAGCGTPAITTRGTSMEEFAKNDENALLVNSCDAEDLCKKIYLLIMNKNLYEKISKNALNEVKSKYSWINKAKELIHLYGEV